MLDYLFDIRDTPCAHGFVFFYSAFRKLSSRVLQFANNWLTITFALRRDMLDFSFKSVGLTYTSTDG